MRVATHVCVLMLMVAGVGCVRRYSIAYVQSQPDGALVTRRDTGASVGTTPMLTPILQRQFFFLHRKGAWMEFEFEKQHFTPATKRVWIDTWGRTPQEGSSIPVRFAAVLKAAPADHLCPCKTDSVESKEK